MENARGKKLSVIMPVYNEESSLKEVINGLDDKLRTLNIEYEILTINDGSTDNSKKILESITSAKQINHPYNKGYGAALRTGVMQAKYEWLLFFDSDGQHNPEYIEEFLNNTSDYVLIAGDRSNSKYVRPLMRKPGLWFLNKIANYLVNFKIPDLNCGLRIINKNELLNYIHLMPHGFSFSTTSTVAFLKDKKNVKFVPIEVNKRKDNSTSFVKPGDAITTLMLIFRLIMLFSPLRIFLPVSAVLFAVGGLLFIQDLTKLNITDSTIFTVLTALLIFFFGLIADQIASLGRRIK